MRGGGLAGFSTRKPELRAPGRGGGEVRKRRQDEEEGGHDGVEGDQGYMRCFGLRWVMKKIWERISWGRAD